MVLKKYFSDATKTSHVEIQKAKKELLVVETRLENLQLLFVDGKIQEKEYNKMRSKFVKEESALKYMMSDTHDASSKTRADLMETINFFHDLPASIKSLDFIDKFDLLSSTFPEKLDFDGKNCRTPRLNKVLDLILNVDGASRGSQKRDKLKKLGLSLRVDPQRIELWSKQALNALSTCVADY